MLRTRLNTQENKTAAPHPASAGRHATRAGRPRTRPAAWLAAGLAAALAGPAAAQQTITDAGITNHIDAEFVESDAVDAFKVSVDTDSGNVVLDGTVNNLLAKRRAEEIAEATVGVESITNEIMVKASDRNDRAIERDVNRALAADPAADAMEVDVEIDDGVAVLAGTVESYAEKRLCETVAAGVDGVTAVTNNIEIVYQVERSDSEIRGDVVGRLRNTVTVNSGMLDVDVSGGDVVITGVVGSAAERQNVYDLAWVPGVESVDVSGVEIDWLADDGAVRSGTDLDVSESGIREAVRNSFRYSPLVNAYNINVTVADHTVTLTGTVEDLRAKNAAADLADGIVGVWEVENYLKVETPAAISDEALEDDIAAALTRDAYLNRFEMAITVDNGHAHLYGSVDTEYEKRRATEVAEAVDGVVSVSNYLEIGATWQSKEDWQIREDINSELFWSPFVDSDEITVEVNNGVATLSGTVDDMEERADASKNAREGGARVVDNDLKVERGPDSLLP